LHGLGNRRCLISLSGSDRGGRLARKFLPLIVSLALVTWLLTRISPQAVAQAATQLNWKLLLPVTAAMVIAVYLWDAVCLPTVYRVKENRWSYLRSLQMRGLSYLGGAFHYEVGQAALAWAMARLQKTGVGRMLARTIVLAYHDIVVLLGLGLLGTLLCDDPRIVRLRPWLALALTLLLAVAFVFWALPAELRARFRRGESESLLEGWSIRRSLQLVPLRVVYFGIFVTYGATALAICHIPVDSHVVLSTMPLVLLADGLPSVSGLGTRETSLQLLLNPESPEVLLAMSLFWTTGLIIGRSLIGVAHLWGQQWFDGFTNSNDDAQA
jgi:hypothetical protein